MAKENQNIANAFFRAAYMESWGRGFEKIVEACETMKSPLPKVRCEHTGLWIEFPFKKLLETPPKGSSKGSPIGGNKLGNKLGNELGNIKKTILVEMKMNPKISGARLADIIGVSSTAVENNIKQLREAGLVKRIGGTRGHWEVIENEK